MIMLRPVKPVRSMKAASIIAWLAFLPLQSLPSLAEEEPYTVKTYVSFAALKADTAKACELISHDCELCIVAKDRTFSCSSVGAACQPRQWRCYEQKPAPR
jgi:hypothetical protein